MPHGRQRRGRQNGQEYRKALIASRMQQYCVPTGLCHHGCADLHAVAGIPTFLQDVWTCKNVTDLATDMCLASPELEAGSEEQDEMYDALIAIGTNLLLAPTLKHTDKFELAKMTAKVYSMFKVLDMVHDLKMARDQTIIWTELTRRTEHLDSVSRLSQFFAKRNSCACLLEVQEAFDQDKTCLCAGCHTWFQDAGALVCPCRSATYCSAECRKDNWDSHKDQCYKNQKKKSKKKK